MKSTSGEIRNSQGSLICDAVYDDGVWTVTVKRKGIYTFITLYSDGGIRVENVSGNEVVSDTEYAITLPT